MSRLLGCPRSTYSCDKGAKCLLLSSLCDGLSDCEDATDERNCPLNPGEFEQRTILASIARLLQTQEGGGGD